MKRILLYIYDVVLPNVLMIVMSLSFYGGFLFASFNRKLFMFFVVVNVVGGAGLYYLIYFSLGIFADVMGEDLKIDGFVGAYFLSIFMFALGVAYKKIKVKIEELKKTHYHMLAILVFCIPPQAVFVNYVPYYDVFGGIQDFQIKAQTVTEEQNIRFYEIIQKYK